MIKRRSDCRLCHDTNLKLVLQLEPSALANEFVQDPFVEQVKYPLDLFQCLECGHYQLLDVVDPEVMFKNYHYVSGTTQIMRQHFRNYACEITNDYDLSPEDLVVDIGSNDGTLIRWLDKLGVKTVGVDPAKNLCDKVSAEGLNVVNAFFNSEVADQIVADHGKAKILTCNNCFAHVDNLDEIVEGVKRLMTPDGTFVFECSYFMDVVLQSGDFSQIYHEHLSFHTVMPLVKFFDRHGMSLVECERIAIHGGSIRCYVQFKTGKEYIEEQDIDALVQNEIDNFLYDDLNCNYIKGRNSSFDLMNAFLGHVANVTQDLKIRLLQLKSEGKTIAAVAASAKSTTFLHHCDIGADIIDYICDDAPEKQGWFTPGKHIPVVPFSTIYDKKPDVLLILSFNFAESIMKRHSEYKGTWIIPCPVIKEINVE